MQIAICDDIQKELETIRAALDTVFLSISTEYAVTAFLLNATHTLEIFNGIKISIPRRSSEEVQQIFMDFCRKEALK